MTTGRGSTRIPVYLATLSHPVLADLAGTLAGFGEDGTLRLANWRHDFESRGEVYLRSQFETDLPPVGSLKSELRLRILNLDQRVTVALQTLTTPAGMTLEMVHAHAPHTVRRSWPNFQLNGAEIDSMYVSGDFGPPPTDGPFMGITINPADNPGAFS